MSNFIEQEIERLRKEFINDYKSRDAEDKASFKQSLNDHVATHDCETCIAKDNCAILEVTQGLHD